MSYEILNLLGLARRAGRLELGEDMTAEAVGAHKARLIVLASDTGANTARKTRVMAGERVPVAVLKSNRAELGGALGRDTCAVCAVTDMGFTAKLAELLRAEDEAFAPIADEIARKSEKMARRKKEKPRKKKV